MVKKILPLFLLLSLTVFCGPVYPKTELLSNEEVCFSPGGQCTKLITDRIGRAAYSIKVQAYTFTSKAIAESLIEARKRGVRVEVIVDASQLSAKGNKVEWLVRGGIPVLVDAKHAIAHDKVMILDGTTVVTGSFNFTKAAEDKNAENVLVIQNKKVAEKYRANWYRHKKHSRPYQSGLLMESARSTKPVRAKKTTADKKVKA